jgi:hypothetical protein
VQSFKRRIERLERQDTIVAPKDVLMARIEALEQRVKTLEQLRRMTGAEALAVFDALKSLNPSLTLEMFADDYGMKYETLKKARTRRTKEL